MPAVCNINMLTQNINGKITLLTITNAIGAKVVLSSLGAGIVSIVVPDAKGRMADVVIGYANPDDYLADGPCAGKDSGPLCQPYSPRPLRTRRQRLFAGHKQRSERPARRTHRLPESYMAG